MRDCPGKSHHLATHHSAGHFPLLFAAFNSFGARNELHQLQPVCNVSWQTDRGQGSGQGTRDSGHRTADSGRGPHPQLAFVARRKRAFSFAFGVRKMCLFFIKKRPELGSFAAAGKRSKFGLRRRADFAECPGFIAVGNAEL